MNKYKPYEFESEHKNLKNDEQLKRLQKAFSEKVKEKKPLLAQTMSNADDTGVLDMQWYLLNNFSSTLDECIEQYQTKRQTAELIELLARMNKFLDDPENKENNEQFQILVEENLEQHVKTSRLYALYVLAGLILCVAMFAALVILIPETAPIIALVIATVVAMAIITASLYISTNVIYTELSLVRMKRQLSNASFFKHIPDNSSTDDSSSDDFIKAFLEGRETSDSPETKTQNMEKVLDMLNKNPLHLIEIMSSHEWMAATYFYANLVDKMKTYYHSENIEDLVALDLLYTEKCFPKLIEACAWNDCDLKRLLENAPPKHLKQIKTSILNSEDIITKIITNSCGLKPFIEFANKLKDADIKEFFYAIIESYDKILENRSAIRP